MKKGLTAPSEAVTLLKALVKTHVELASLCQGYIKACVENPPPFEDAHAKGIYFGELKRRVEFFKRVADEYYEPQDVSEFDSFHGPEDLPTLAEDSSAWYQYRTWHRSTMGPTRSNDQQEYKKAFIQAAKSPASSNMITDLNFVLDVAKTSDFAQEGDAQLPSIAITPVIAQLQQATPAPEFRSDLDDIVYYRGGTWVSGRIAEGLANLESKRKEGGAKL